MYKKLFYCVLLCFIVVFITSCGNKNTYYSLQEIKKFKPNDTIYVVFSGETTVGAVMHNDTLKKVLKLNRRNILADDVYQIEYWDYDDVISGN